MAVQVEQMKVTSVEDLKGYVEGAIVELPPFADFQPFTARLTRPSMMAMAKSGKIPNELLGVAASLFAGEEVPGKDKEDRLNKIMELMEVMAEASFKEPTYKEIKDSGVQMTDDQYMFIFTYSQQGVKALNSFRR